MKKQILKKSLNLDNVLKIATAIVGIVEILKQVIHIIQ